MGTTAPPGMGRAGLALWRQITGDYDLRADELKVLESACREASLIERLDNQLADAPLMIEGSQGQQVINPLVSEIRQHRVALKGLLAQLKLDDGDEPDAGRSSQARAAAQARWSRRGS